MTDCVDELQPEVGQDFLRDTNCCISALIEFQFSASIILFSMMLFHISYFNLSSSSHKYLNNKAANYRKYRNLNTFTSHTRHPHVCVSMKTFHFNLLLKDKYSHEESFSSAIAIIIVGFCCKWICYKVWQVLQCHILRRSFFCVCVRYDCRMILTVRVKVPNISARNSRIISFLMWNLSIAVWLKCEVFTLWLFYSVARIGIYRKRVQYADVSIHLMALIDLIDLTGLIGWMGWRQAAGCLSKKLHQSFDWMAWHLTHFAVGIQCLALTSRFATNKESESGEWREWEWYVREETKRRIIYDSIEAIELHRYRALQLRAV